MDNKCPIGFFDSGLGGISVLREAVKLLPNENYIYIGDSVNAPYGTKLSSEIRELTDKSVEKLISMGVKAIVIACNTATSAGIDFLRQKYPNISIIGVEPALKPAVEHFPNGKIIVMATETTLKEEKFHSLCLNYGKTAQIIPAPCSGLMEFVEQGVLDGDELDEYLHAKLDVFLDSPVDAIVLGCTHYPFVKKAIQNVVGNSVLIIDGGEGTAKQLQRRLLQANLLNQSFTNGSVTFFNSCDNNDFIELSHKLLNI